MEMTERDDAMQEHMAYLVFVQHRTFSYLDFLNFEVNGVQYNMSHGIFRNKISKFIGAGKVELVCNSGLGFYSLKGIQIQKKLMTPNHMGVVSSVTAVFNPTSTPPSIYNIIKELPLDNNSLHDIHLRFEVPGIWTILFASVNVDTPQLQQQQKQQQPLRLNSISKDISPPPWEIKGLNIKVTVHRTNIVSIVVGCSYAPIATDIGGVIRLSNALTRVEERISRLVDDCGKVIPGGYESLPIPEHNVWNVTMWHFGADASIEYAGEKFSATYEVTENALVRAYSKVMEDGKTRIRLERQEYPRKTFADAIEEKLYLNTEGGSNYY
jgi:hypothetical protein